MPKYPAQIDNSQSLPTAVDNLTPVQGSIFNKLRDAVLAVESELGVKPAGSYTTVRARIDNLEDIVGNLQIIELHKDLGGTIEDPLVVGIQGRPVSTVEPDLEQILIWNGVAWVPTTYLVDEINGSPVTTIGATNTVLGTTDGYNITYFKITNNQIDSAAAIVYSKLSLTGSIVNADINASAAISYSKLNLSTSIVNADVASGAAIVYSKLNLTGGIVNADINASAAIAYSKLNLATSIVNADIAAGAVVAVNKLAAGTAGQVLLNSSTPTPTWTTISGDGTIGSTGTLTVTDISGASGFIDVGSSGNQFRWNTTTTAPGIFQTDNATNSATAAAMTIQAQNATGTTSTGGSLILTSGAGTTTAGNTSLRTGGVDKLVVHPTFIAINGTSSSEALRITPASSGTTSIEFATGVTSAKIFQADRTANGVAGNDLLIQAANATGTSSNGGDLDLRAGTGTNNDGRVFIRNGATATITVSSDTIALGSGVALTFEEQASPPTTSVGPGNGGFWFRNDTPSTPMAINDLDKAVPIQNGGAQITAANSVTAATTILNTTGVHTIKANSLVVGSVYRVEYDFQFTRGGTATAMNIECQVDIDGGTITPSILVASQTSSATYRGSVVCTFTCLAIGAFGSLATSFKYVGDVFPSGSVFMSGSTGSAIDTTQDITVQGKVNMASGVASTVIRAINGYVTQVC